MMTPRVKEDGGRKQAFKKRILAWLAKNGITPKEVRVYDTRRYGLEVRVYHGATEFPNMRKSRRKMELDESGNNCTYGIHSRKINLYTAINEEALATKEERDFTLRCLRDNNL